MLMYVNECVRVNLQALHTDQNYFTHHHHHITMCKVEHYCHPSLTIAVGMYTMPQTKSKEK